MGNKFVFGRNPLSRGSPSAVTVGAEILIEREGADEDGWITLAEREEKQGVLERYWYLT